MTSLPPLVLRAPSLFYGAAALFFLASIGLALTEINTTMGHADAGDPMAKMMMVRALYQAALESVYIAANGVIAQILLAIWQDARLGRDRGGDS